MIVLGIIIGMIIIVIEETVRKRSDAIALGIVLLLIVLCTGGYYLIIWLYDIVTPIPNNLKNGDVVSLTTTAFRGDGRPWGNIYVALDKRAYPTLSGGKVSENDYAYGSVDKNLHDMEVENRVIVVDQGTEFKILDIEYSHGNLIAHGNILTGISAGKVGWVPGENLKKLENTGVTTSNNTTANVDSTQIKPPPQLSLSPKSVKETSVCSGDKVTLLENAPLYFNDNVYQQGHKGDEYTVAQYSPGKHRVYFITQNSSGKQIGINVSDASVCLKPLTTQETHNCRNYLQQAQEDFRFFLEFNGMKELDDAIASAKKADECLPSTNNTIKFRTQRIISELAQHKKLVNTDPSKFRFGVEGVIKSSKEMLDSDFEETLRQLSNAQ